jgi:ectoine hydroxylase-related dioxygenase (phytanoyl-CoA dioxygenase family)
MSTTSQSQTYLANQIVSEEQIQEWVETFHRQGFLFLEDVLPPEWCAELREDLDWALLENPNGLNSVSERVALAHRMFETSKANLRLFDLEPIVGFAEALVAKNCHVIHNNSFQSRPGGGITRWHQDDAPHFIVTDGEAPTNVHLPVLFFTANYYLTDVGLNQPKRLSHRMFEHSRANVRLFDLEPIVSFAEALVAKNCHVIHNNSFITLPGEGKSRWHQDDPPHLIVTGGELPTNVHLPPLFFTANYYLTDVTEIEHGGTEVIPVSHLFGASPPSELEGTQWEDQLHYNLGKAGSVIMFNNQTWHRGGPNRSDRTRYITQITYARRIIGHKYYPFMNYTMPEHIYKDANPRLRRLLGFLEHGTYG